MGVADLLYDFFGVIVGMTALLLMFLLVPQTSSPVVEAEVEANSDLITSQTLAYSTLANYHNSSYPRKSSQMRMISLLYSTYDEANPNPEFNLSWKEEEISRSYIQTQIASYKANIEDRKYNYWISGEKTQTGIMANYTPIPEWSQSQPRGYIMPVPVASKMDEDPYKYVYVQSQYVERPGLQRVELE